MGAYFLLDTLPREWLSGRFSVGLMLLSFSMMVLAAYATFAQVWLMREAFEHGQRAKGMQWWVMASATLALGIFSLHFIAMLGFELSTGLNYNLGLTLLSALLAWGGSALGLSVLRAKSVSLPKLIAGGCAMGASAAGMHFVGMTALHGTVGLLFAPGVWLLTILIALLVGVVALACYARFSVYWGQWQARRFVVLAMGLALGVAIMHYVGMSAAHFYAGGVCGVDLPLLSVVLQSDDLRWETIVAAGGLIVLVLAVSNVSAQQVTALRGQLGETQASLLQQQQQQQIISQFAIKLQQESPEKNWLLHALNSNAIFSVTDARGMIVHASEPFCQVSGYSHAELLGATHRLVNAGADSVTDWGEVWGTIQSGRTWSGLVCNRRKDGTLYWVDTTITPYLDSQGMVRNYVSVRFEVTAIRALEQEVQRLHHILSGAIEAVDEAFCVYDQNDRLVFFNGKYKKVYDESQDAIKEGNTFEEIIRYGAQRGQYSAAVGRVEEWVQERLAKHRMAHSALIQPQPNGRVLRISETRTKLGYTVGFRVDVTELYRARELAERATRTKSEFLANMSHEIRTPLHAVSGMLGLLKKTQLTWQQQDYVEKAELAARSLLGLINDILDVSKMDAGKLLLESKPFALADELKELRAILVGFLKSDDVEILLDFDPLAMRSYVGDRLRLHQVLLNLLSNAIKFTSAGSVTMRVQVLSRDEQGQRLLFEVKDTGMGISSEFQEQMFKAFVQADASVSRKFGGTGLGLKISHDLVRLMGGQLQFESQLGLGTRFFFELQWPYASGQISDMPRMAPAAREVHALMVDDSPAQRALLQAMGQGLGWQVEVCDSGETALQRLRQAQQGHAVAFDIVFMDKRMPGLNGVQACEQLRQWDATTPVVLMCSSHEGHMQKQDGLESLNRLGLAQVVLKPMTASVLFDALSNAQGSATQGSSRMAVTNDAADETLPLSGVQVLLAEDNVVNQQVAREMLESEGAQVDVAANGQVAVDKLLTAPQRYHVVLMDMQMPEVSGLEATEKIRADARFTQMPIIAMTANAGEEDRQACLASGMNDHIAKPLDWAALTELILSHVGKQA